MRVALIDVDSHNFPNLVLMKLSAWHKARGDEVTLLSVATALHEEISNEKPSDTRRRAFFILNRCQPLEASCLAFAKSA